MSLDRADDEAVPGEVGTGGMLSMMYDEFGNYVGPDLDDDDEEEGFDNAPEEREREPPSPVAPDRGMDVDNGSAVVEFNEQRSVVLHQDKKYFPTAEEVYPQAEVLVEEEDAQPLSTPIVAPVKEKKFQTVERTLPPTTFSTEYLCSLMTTPQLVRNVTIAGQLHHGKTSFMDMFVQQTHEKNWSLSKNLRYTDTRDDEQEIGVSIKTTPMSLVLPNSIGKNYLVNLFDTPGHVNFSDEVTASFRLCDGVVVLVDAVEGVMVQTERVIKHALLERLPIVVVINKLDRIILELKLPPADAYHKLRHTIDEINQLVESNAQGGERVRVSPELGNVMFASSIFGFCFSLQTFAQMYTEQYTALPQSKGLSLDAESAQTSFGMPNTAEELAKRLWGDIYYHPDARMFKTTPPPKGNRSFVEFVLEPLYKIFSHVIGEERETLEPVLLELGISLRAHEYHYDTNVLLRLVLTRFFGRSTGFVDMVVKHFPSPIESARTKVEQSYTGPLNTKYGTALTTCDPNGPLLIHVCKLYTKPDCSGFDAFGRVMSGTVRVGDHVRVLGEAYTPTDEEDMAEEDVTKLWILQSRYRVGITSAPAGNWVLIGGVDSSILKTATIVNAVPVEQPYIFKPLNFNTLSVMKVAVEPLRPSELPKMLDALRKINKSYPLCITKKEESGEHTILGTGEIYLDSILRDLRHLYSDIEIKVADPVVAFCETVAETSSLKCFGSTPNKKNKLTMIAEPLEKGLAEEIENRVIRAEWDPKTTADFLLKKYGWDFLAARSLWAFGPDTQGPNALIDDTLPTEVDKRMLSTVKKFIIQGFQWATKEGPLCEEPIRNVKYKLIDAQMATEEIQRSGVQIIPTARRVCYSAFLMAAPRLMEPVYFVEVQAPADCISAVVTVLSRRRGYVTAENPRPGTPLYTLKAFVPVIDSFGFETDLRTHTQGQAFCLSVFDHWAVVPGDPLDKNIMLRPLTVSQPTELAREFMVKTRRRKGLSEDVTVSKFFDEELVAAMAKENES
ncbi:110 kDa U5 small nuclear ribonucleoprotein component CLO [Pelomyxa schiedti]|nr:110 kDa U5 small nuclear ribonucleoprotein component CLO [Pelomyxa schiedti]